MKLGIIGLPQSGKTTLFNALTRGTQPTGLSAGKIEVHTAVVDVPDPRVDRLSAMFKPKKTIYAKVTYADVAGLEGSAAKTGISGALLNQLTQMDGFIQVVRCFEDDAVPHPAGSIDPVRDIASMESELILNDLISVERKLERLAEEKKKGADVTALPSNESWASSNVSGRRWLKKFPCAMLTWTQRKKRRWRVLASSAASPCWWCSTSPKVKPLQRSTILTGTARW